MPYSSYHLHQLLTNELAALSSAATCLRYWPFELKALTFLDDSSVSLYYFEQFFLNGVAQFGQSNDILFMLSVVLGNFFLAIDLDAEITVSYLQSVIYT